MKIVLHTKFQDNKVIEKISMSERKCKKKSNQFRRRYKGLS